VHALDIGVCRDLVVGSEMSRTGSVRGANES
jgi:hypothetical protein